MLDHQFDKFANPFYIEDIIFFVAHQSLFGAGREPQKNTNRGQNEVDRKCLRISHTDCRKPTSDASTHRNHPPDRSDLQMVCRPQRKWQTRTQVPCHVRFGPNFSYRQKVGQAAQPATKLDNHAINRPIQLIGTLALTWQLAGHGICRLLVAPLVRPGMDAASRRAGMNFLEFIALRRNSARFSPDRVCRSCLPNWPVRRTVKTGRNRCQNVESENLHSRPQRAPP